MMPIPSFEAEIIPEPPQKRQKGSNDNILPSMKLEKATSFSNAPGWVYQTPVKKLVFNSILKEA